MAPRKKTQVALTFDTTGSMRPCIAEVRRKLEQMLKSLFAEIPDLEIAIGAHGDYCDARTSYVTKWIDFTSDLHALTKFVRDVGNTGGGDAEECYELVLHEARDLSWDVHSRKILVPFADDRPHPAHDRQNVLGLDWRTEAQELAKIGVEIYAVQCLGKSYANAFYRELASITGGYHLALDQFQEVVDLIVAIGYKQVGAEQLARHEETVYRSGRMSRTLDRAFNVLAERSDSIRFKPLASGLEPVSPGRFQMLRVDIPSDIRGFVEHNDLEFRKGKGFYEFTKTETIQEGKEVVLRDKETGDMYTGDVARSMIGLPSGVRGRLKPAHLDKYDVFVQSTSYNRKLVPGTRFLYEVDMSR